MRKPNPQNRKREIRKHGNVYQYIETSCQCSRVLRVFMEDQDLRSLQCMVKGWQEEEERRMGDKYPVYWKINID